MLNVFLVSDQPVLLQGFEQILRAAGFEVAGTSRTSSLATMLASGPRPDLVLLDVTTGLTFSKMGDVHNRVPDCPVVLWADAIPLELIFKTLELGVRGVVQRNSPPDQLIDSLRKVASGELQIGFGSSRDSAPGRRSVSLTPREREIVTYLRQGMRNKQIAGEMGITEGTVKIYLFRLFQKLGVRNRFDLARCGAADERFQPPLHAAQQAAGFVADA